MVKGMVNQKISQMIMGDLQQNLKILKRVILFEVLTVTNEDGPVVLR